MFSGKFKLKMSKTTQQLTFIQTPTHKQRNMEQKPYIMKTSITVINIPESRSMEISIKRPTCAYRVTSEFSV